MQNELNTLLTFTPYYKSVIWGGTKIAVLKGESNDMPDLGESWELSAVPGHESVVNAGPSPGRMSVSLSTAMVPICLVHAL